MQHGPTGRLVLFEHRDHLVQRFGVSQKLVAQESHPLASIGSALLSDPRDLWSPVEIEISTVDADRFAFGQHPLPAGKIFAMMPTQGLGEQSPGSLDLVGLHQLSDSLAVAAWFR